MSGAEQVEPDAPEGYRWEWVPEGDEWRLGGDGRKCSRALCLNPALVLLRRKHRRFAVGSNEGYAWWGYCAEHMYGRKIEDGMVKFRRLLKNAA